MTALLTAGALVATFVLLLSAVRTGTAATASDPNPRGPWGILERTPNRSRSLNPHERRWQTALLSGRKNSSRWKDVVAELTELRRRAGCDGEPAPDRYDVGWIDRTIDELERSVQELPQHNEGPFR